MVRVPSRVTRARKKVATSSTADRSSPASRCCTATSISRMDACWSGSSRPVAPPSDAIRAISSKAGGGAWVGDLGVGGHVDQVGDAGVEGPAQGRAELGRGGDQLTAGPEGLGDQVVAALGLEVGGHVVAV